MNILKVFDSELKRMKEKGWDCIYVLLDIHGTIFVPSYQNKETFEFYPYAVEALQILSSREDIKIILWSSTKLNYLNNYSHVLADNDIYVDYLNFNNEVKNEDCDIYSASFNYKTYFNVGIDDRFGFEPETDWKELYEYLINNNNTKITEL